MSAVTEKEAAEMWCPAVRFPDDQLGGGTFNRGGVLGGVLNIHPANADTACNCIGSRCMWWRWTEPLSRRCRIPDGPDCTSETEPRKRPSNVPPSWTWDGTGFVDGEACWIEPESEARARLQGYCGMAGKPDEEPQ